MYLSSKYLLIAVIVTGADPGAGLTSMLSGGLRVSGWDRRQQGAGQWEERTGPTGHTGTTPDSVWGPGTF